VYGYEKLLRSQVLIPSLGQEWNKAIKHPQKGLPFSYYVLLALSHSEWPQIEGCMVYMSSLYVQLLGHIPILNVLYQLQKLLGYIPILNVLRGHPLAGGY